MGSRQSNTSWCWSPRKKCPEHEPPPSRKTYEQRLQESFEEKLYKRWWEENRWKYVEPKVYDHTDNDWDS